MNTGRYNLAQEAFRNGLSISPEDGRLLAGLKAASASSEREKSFHEAEQIKACLVVDDEFHLMCMCPGDNYMFLRRWLCIPSILFAFGHVSLTTDSKRQLDEIGKALNSGEPRSKKWIIIGHADCVGTPERNLRYSRERVAAVTSYLVHRCGIDSQWLTTQVFDQDRPRATNDTLEDRSENRRVEIVLDE